MRIVLIAFALSAGLGVNLAGCAMPEEYTGSDDGNTRVWTPYHNRESSRG